MIVISGVKMYDRKEVAKKLQCSMVTLASYSKKGKLPFVRLGNKAYVSETNLLKYLNGE